MEQVDKRSKGTPKHAQKLQKQYAKQQKRKIKSQPLPDPNIIINLDDFVSFSEHLKSSKRILALLGAGLSAASGIPTFRGAGGFWREHDATELATPEAFFKNPSTVWQFYNYRREGAIKAVPNRAHLALAKLAKLWGEEGFLAISQNIDGLSQRAGHPKHSIELIHGSVFDIKCSEKKCDYVQADNYEQPFSPALVLDEEHDISDVKFPLKDIARRDLPHCPKCAEQDEDSLLRPGVVWFGESLPMPSIEHIDEWMKAAGKVDLMLVIGTSACVFPAAGYIGVARNYGARVAVFNMEEPEIDEPATNLRDGDWFFKGDAGELVPELLKAAIGEIKIPKDTRLEKQLQNLSIRD
ncbi:MAG: hypothetical protein M1820_007080 [Bogoriella megaspora]|nr:MAG: hypothetical protein M1820_007080 [Bogoriella megaspora]